MKKYLFISLSAFSILFNPCCESVSKDYKDGSLSIDEHEDALLPFIKGC